jgi:hypothetical protein
MIEWIYFYLIIFSQKEMVSKKHTADVVVHDMIERINFYSINFSQKEMGSKKHTSDVVVPASCDVLPPGEVYVPFPSGSGNSNGSYHSCPGRILESDQTYPAPVFDSKTQKQVLCTIWKPRMGTFQNVLDTMP